MKVARVTVRAMTQRLARGFHTVVGALDGASKDIGEVWAAALIAENQYTD
jgi:hypothetical protein